MRNFYETVMFTHCRSYQDINITKTGNTAGFFGKVTTNAIIDFLIYI